MKCSLIPFFFLVIRCGAGGGGGGGGDFGSGSGSKFNCAARVGSDDLGYGPGSGFSFEPVQTSRPNTSVVPIMTETDYELNLYSFHPPPCRFNHKLRDTASSFCICVRFHKSSSIIKRNRFMRINVLMLLLKYS